MLMKCPECGHDMSSLAEACPNCGYKLVQEETQNTDNATNTQNIENNSYSNGANTAKAVVGGILGYSLLKSLFRPRRRMFGPAVPPPAPRGPKGFGGPHGGPGGFGRR